MHRARGCKFKNVSRYSSIPHEKPVKFLRERAIFTSKNDQVAAINDMPLKFFDGEEMVYTSIVTVVYIGDDTRERERDYSSCGHPRDVV